MNVDIVERLRSEADDAETALFEHVGDCGFQDVMRLAADEIERLRGVVAGMRKRRNDG